LWIIGFPESGNSGISEGSSERAIEKVYSFESEEKTGSEPADDPIAKFPRHEFEPGEQVEDQHQPRPHGKVDG